jgi:hypothetical protein
MTSTMAFELSIFFKLLWIEALLNGGGPPPAARPLSTIPSYYLKVMLTVPIGFIQQIESSQSKKKTTST